MWCIHEEKRSKLKAIFASDPQTCFRSRMVNRHQENDLIGNFEALHQKGPYLAPWWIRNNPVHTPLI